MLILKMESETSSDDDFNQSVRRQMKQKMTSSSKKKNHSRIIYHSPNTSKEASKQTSPYDKLRPKRLVNNFTKENNRYNFDPVYTDDSSGAEDFIDDDDDNEDESDESNQSEDAGNAGSSDGEKSLKLRSKNGGVLESDSDDSDSPDKDGDRKRNNSIIESDSDSSATIIMSPKKTNKQLSPLQNISPAHQDDSDEEIISPKPRTKLKQPKSTSKRNVVDSSSDSDSCCVAPSKKRAYLVSDDSISSDDDDFERLYSSNEECDDRLPSERVQVMDMRKQHRRDLLEELKAKRKMDKSVEKG